MIKSIVFLFLFLTFIQSKLYQNQFSLPTLRRNKGWIFLDRMSVGVGQVDINFEGTLTSANVPETEVYTIELAIIPDNSWQRQAAFKCQNPQAQISKDVGQRSTQTQIIYLDFSHATALKVKETLSFQQYRPITYHFVLRDCSKKMVNEYFNRQSRLKVLLDIKNNGQEHGEDEESFSFLLPISLIVTGLMLYFSKQKSGQIKIGAQSNTDWAKLLLHLALWFNFIALVLFYIGFQIYIYGGKQYNFFDFMYLLLHSLSQSLVTGLLIFVAYGWTITFLKTVDFDLYIPLVGMIGLVNIILTLLTKINDGDHNKYHMHDTIPSYLLLGFRFMTLMVFSIGIFITWRKSKNEEHIKSFITKIGIVGNLYFLSLPIMVFGCTMIHISERRWVIFIGQEMLKNVMNLWLTWMVSSKKSSYSQISKGSKSFMQNDNKYL